MPSMTINELVDQSHSIALAKGWWKQTAWVGGTYPGVIHDSIEPQTRNIGELLMLQVSELAEALEDARNGDNGKIIRYAAGDSQYNLHGVPVKPIGLAIEMADLFIRAGDFCGGLGIPIADAIKIKMEYNKTRPYKHGKVF